MRYTLKKSEILRGKNSFQEVFEKGRRCEQRFLRCFYIVRKSGANRPTPSQPSIRIPAISAGFAVSRQIRRAVDRNRVKRLMRESYRMHKHAIIEKCREQNLEVSTVFLFTPPATARQIPSYAETSSAMELLLGSIDLRETR